MIMLASTSALKGQEDPDPKEKKAEKAEKADEVKRPRPAVVFKNALREINSRNKKEKAETGFISEQSIIEKNKLIAKNLDIAPINDVMSFKKFFASNPASVEDDWVSKSSKMMPIITAETEADVRSLRGTVTDVELYVMIKSDYPDFSDEILSDMINLGVEGPRFKKAIPKYIGSLPKSERAEAWSSYLDALLSKSDFSPSWAAHVRLRISLLK